MSGYDGRVLRDHRAVGVAGELPAVGVAALAFTVVYGLRAFRTVYQEPWRPVVLKAGGIGLLYVMACLVGLIATIAWVSVA